MHWAVDMIKKSLAVSKSITQIQKRIFITQFILIILLAVVLGGAGIIINISYETQKRDLNLQNISQTIATSPLLDDIESGITTEYVPSISIRFKNPLVTLTLFPLSAQITCVCITPITP